MSSNHNCCYHRTSGMPQAPNMSHRCADPCGHPAPGPAQPTARQTCSSHPGDPCIQRTQTIERNMPRMPKTHMHKNTPHQTSCHEKEFPIAMAYVPWQKFRDVYPPEKAFCQGTIFAELDLPFYGCRKGGFR